MAISDLPVASGRKIAQTLVPFGWTIRSVGNHIVLTKAGVSLHLSIPNHREVDRALLHSELRKAGISDKIFREAFDEL